MTQVETKNQLLNQLSHLHAPKTVLFFLLLIPLECFSEIGGQKNLCTVIYLHYVIESVFHHLWGKEGYSRNIPIYNFMFMNKNPEKKT